MELDCQVGILDPGGTKGDAEEVGRHRAGMEADRVQGAVLYVVWP